MKVKRTLLLALIISAGLIFTSCGGKDTQYIASYGQNKIPTGVYVMYEQFDAVSEVLKKLVLVHPEIAKKSADTKEFFEPTYDGKTVESMVMDRAKTEILIYLGGEKLFEDLKLELTEDQKDAIKQVQKSFRDAESKFSKIGVGKESYSSYYEGYEKNKALFDYYYGEKGTKRPSDEKLREYFDANYLKLATKPFYYGESEESKEKSKASVDKFLGVVSNSGLGEALRLDEIEEKERQKEAEEERKKLEEEMKHEAPEPEASVEVKESEEPEESDTVEIPEDARKRLEGSSTHTSLKRDISLNFGAENLKKIEAAAIDVPILIDLPDQKTTTVVIKRANDNDSFESLKSTLISESCMNEFESLLIERAKQENLKFNQAAIEAFRPTRLCADT